MRTNLPIIICGQQYRPLCNRGQPAPRTEPSRRAVCTTFNLRADCRLCSAAVTIPNTALLQSFYLNNSHRNKPYLNKQRSLMFEIDRGLISINNFTYPLFYAR